MTDPNSSDLSPADQDLSTLGERLRTERATLSPLELDGIKVAILGRTGRRPSRRRVAARLAGLGALACGVLLTGAGVTLGVVAVGDTGNAALLAEQGSIEVPNVNASDVKGETGGGGGGTQPGGGHEVHGEAGGGTPTPTGEDLRPPKIRPTAQVAAAGTRSLPFTGYLAAPLLGIGLLLGSAGVLLRRRQRPIAR